MGIWCWRLVLAIGSFGHPMKRGASITFRTLAETARLKERLLSARHVTVVGAGFIGPEFASAARLKRLIVDVIKLGQRLMERAVTPEISQFFLRRHERSGVNFHFGLRSQASNEPGRWSIYDRSCAREKDRDRSCRCRNRRQSEYGACRFRRVGRQWWNSCRPKSVYF
jgi:NAD(P)H-nitrite reductase large subunit